MSKIPKLKYEIVSIVKDWTTDDFPREILEVLGYKPNESRYYVSMNIHRRTKTFSFKTTDELEAMRVVDVLVKAWWGRRTKRDRYDRPKR